MGSIKLDSPSLAGAYLCALCDSVVNPLHGSDMTNELVLILDFGSQVTQLIARRVREEGVYSEIVPFQKADEAFKAMKPKAVILSGGPASVHEKGAPLAPPAIRGCKATSSSTRAICRITLITMTALPNCTGRR